MSAQPELPQISEQTRVTLPIVAIIACIVAIASGGGTYAVTQLRLSEGERRDEAMAKRVEKLEDKFETVKVLLERIDERTKELIDQRKARQ